VTNCSVAAADRHLSGEVKEEWQELDELKPEPSSPADVAERRDKLLEMVYQIVPYLMQHNAEAEACDVLMEIERLDLLQQYVDRSAFPRVCLYLRRSVYSSVTLSLIGRNTPCFIFQLVIMISVFLCVTDC